jgi:hypothetical protein
MQKNKQRIEHTCGRIFLVIFLLALPIVWARLLLRGQADKFFEIENRRADILPTLNASNFLDNSFQNQLEKALSDQMPQSETVRLGYIKANKLVFDELSWISTNPHSNYHLVRNNLYTYGEHDYLVLNNLKTLNADLDSRSSIIRNDAAYYSSLPIKNKYQYIVNQDAAIDFDNPNNAYIERIMSLYPGFKQSYLHIADFKVFERYYLKNDHHWNYVGQYRGYKDIIDLMFDNNEPVMIPAETITFKLNTVGSKSRAAYPLVFNEPFKTYRFDYKDHDVFVGNTLTEYGNKSYYNSKEMREAEGTITYNQYFGFDEEIILYDYKQPKKENLIIVGYSDTNAINELVASHFNKTWVLDPRFSSHELLEKIISENTIQNLLLVPNTGLLVHALNKTPGGYN